MERATAHFEVQMGCFAKPARMGGCDGSHEIARAKEHALDHFHIGQVQVAIQPPLGALHLDKEPGATKPGLRTESSIHHGFNAGRARR